mgnify:FL=1|jgi:hypothetical protein
MLVARNRCQDIELRGKHAIVSDYNGKPVKLANAKIWYNHDGKYVEPKDYCDTHVQDTDSCCFNLFGIFNQDDIF